MQKLELRGPRRLQPKLILVLSLVGLLAPLVPAHADVLAASSLKDVRKTVGRNFVHTVQSGESIFTIAQRYNLAVDHLAFANGFPPTAVEIDPGIALIIPKQRVLPANPPRDGIVLNLPERGLYFFRNGAFDRFVPVSIGDEKGFPTPTGQFHVIERINNPTWYPPAWAKDRKPVGPGPANPLGKHWIGLSLPRTGIHGTNQPLNVGNSVTHGCIRAYPEAVAQLFAEVKVGWPVRIEYETVKLGRDPEGRLKVVTFPDVYQKQPPLEAVRNRLGSQAADTLAPLVRLELGVCMEVERRGALLKEVQEGTPGK